METISGILKNGHEINCILQWLELVHLVSILQDSMCLKIVEYKILVQVLDKSIQKDFNNFEAKTSFCFSVWYSYCFHGYNQREVGPTHVLLSFESRRPFKICQ